MCRILVAVLAFSLTTSLSLFSQTNYTWADDVACIVYSHCTNCHNAEGVAPFTLESYDDVAQRANAIMFSAVVEQTMPPFPAKGPHNAFVGDYSLEQTEIDILKEWLENDLPTGDLSTAPAVPNFEQEFEIENPDHIIELPEFTVPNLPDDDLYRCFVFPAPFSEDLFVKGLEVIPGNTRAVHHVLMYFDPSGTSSSLDAQDPEIGYSCFGGIGTNDAQLIGGWAPGGSAQFFPDNMGVRLPSDGNIVVQVHYPSYAAGEVDQTSIRLNLTSENQRELYVVPILNHFTSMINGPLYIPANTVKTFDQEFELWGKMTMVGTAPHAHLICTDMESWAEAPNGDRIDLINIPRWDFDWQKFYGYKRPIILDGGTVIKGRATYDNTVNNHHNPSFPPEDIWVGEATTDEMMVFFYTFTPYQSGDENLIFDDPEHHNHVGACNLTNNDNLNDLSIHLSPNPSNDFFRIETNDHINTIRMYDVHGHLVLSRKNVHSGQLIDIQTLQSGSYVVHAEAENGTFTKVMVKN